MTDSPVPFWKRVLGGVRWPFPWRRPPVRDPRDPRGPGLPEDERLAAQVAEFQYGLVADALRDLGGIGGIPFDEGKEETAFLAHPGRVVCRWEDAQERLQPYFDRRVDEYVAPVEARRMFGDLAVFELPARSDDEEHDIVRLLADLDENVGRDVAFPDHVVHVAPAIGGGGRMCPATEPELPLGQGPVPAPSRDATAGAGIKVSVVDTGWHPDASKNAETPWLGTSVADIEGDEETVVKTDIGPYVGHGTFVAGVIRCLAPQVELEIEGVLKHAGAVYESDIAMELHEAMTDLEDDELPRVISISAGTYTRNDAGMLAFALLSELYRLGLEDDGPLVVAAAGNENTSRPFYPAAFDWVVGVGALDEKMRTPTFTNFGKSWVDVWAHGTDLVNAFPQGTYYVKEPGPAQGEERHFTGMAQWSGTSFATPIVSGLIAAIMSETGKPARQARDELVQHRSMTFTCLPKVAKGIAVGPPFV
jgi:hypothetical protein